MTGSVRRSIRFCANAAAVATALIFMIVQSAMLQVHAAPAANTDDGRKIETVQATVHDHGHDHGSIPSKLSSGHVPLPDSSANGQGCEDLCCISGCPAALLTDRSVDALPPSENIFLAATHLHYFSRSTAPPDNPPRF